MYNKQLIDLIDHPEWQYLYFGLRERWPQINDKTKVIIEHYHTLYFPYENAAPQPLPTWRVYENWNEWRRSFFTYKTLDSFDDRWKYSKKVVTNILRIPHLIYLWLAGRMSEDLPMLIPLPEYRQVEMQKYGISDQVNDYFFYCHYEPCTDTFYYYNPRKNKDIQKLKKLELTKEL